MTAVRATRLAVYAKLCLEVERESELPAGLARQATRRSMADVAADVGFTPAEIEAAIDAAIETATTPATGD